jgi:hypothetical protein
MLSVRRVLINSSYVLFEPQEYTKYCVQCGGIVVLVSAQQGHGVMESVDVSSRTMHSNTLHGAFSLQPQSISTKI